MIQPLGLCSPPTAFYLFVGETGEDCLWYTLDGQDKQVPVHDQALHGDLKEVRIIEREFRGRKSDKLELVVSADRTYVVRSGLETTWSRGILLALEAAPDLARPLYFCVRNADNEKVVFSSLYTAAGERVLAEWDKERDLKEVVTLLRSRLGLAGAQSPASQPLRHASPPATAAEPAADLDSQILRAAEELGYDAAKVRKWVNQKFEVTGGLESLTPHDKREVLKIFKEQAGSRGTRGVGRN